MKHGTIIWDIEVVWECKNTFSKPEFFIRNQNLLVLCTSSLVLINLTFSKVRLVFLLQNVVEATDSFYYGALWSELVKLMYLAIVQIFPSTNHCCDIYFNNNIRIRAVIAGCDFAAS